MTKYTIDDVVRMLRATHEAMHITHQLLASVEARIQALETGQMIDLQLTHKLSDSARREILAQLKAVTDRERGRIEKMVRERLDKIGDELAAPKPPLQN